MNRIYVYRMGFAVGATFATLYLGCLLVVCFNAHVNAVAFFNSFTHFFDVSSIVRTTIVSPFEFIAGLVEWFILGWLIGACIAAFYNSFSKP